MWKKDQSLAGKRVARRKSRHGPVEVSSPECDAAKVLGLMSSMWLASPNGINDDRTQASLFGLDDQLEHARRDVYEQ